MPLEADTHRYAANGKLQAYRSQDHGQSWSPAGQSMPETPAYVGVLRDALVVDALEPAGVYFGTNMGELFYSTDAGDTWGQQPGLSPRITCVKSWVQE